MNENGFYVDLPPAEEQGKNIQNCSAHTGDSTNSLVVNTFSILNWLVAVVILCMIGIDFVLIAYICDLRNQNNALIRLNNQLAAKLSTF